eukprot:scaffold46054_cov14-Tisochrysis_lutea.AAC.1
MDELLHRMAAYNACLPSAFQRQCFNNQNPATNEVTAGLSETSPRNHKYTSRGQAFRKQTYSASLYSGEHDKSKDHQLGGLRKRQCDREGA